MIESLYRLRSWVAKSVSGISGSTPLAQRVDSSNGSNANPLTQLHQVVQNAQPLVEQQLAAARMTDELLTSIERQLGEAWGERENLIGNYYALLRSVLTVVEDCRSSSDDSPELQVVRTGLEKTLRQQGIEVTPVAEGDVFQPDIQSCEKVEPSVDCVPGRVLRILETGYQQRLADGSVVVVRPAKVVISQPSANP
jgi:molecular chaperone GrpE (heat shock protein)